MSSSRKEADCPPCLKNMDTILHCPICFDFLNITMMTKCSHNFCSLCIRKYLSYKKLQCPVCNSPMTEQDLRNNRILDELVVSFQTVRQQLSEASCYTPPLTPDTPASAVKGRTPSQRDGPKKDGSIRSHFFQKGPKTLNTANMQQASPAAPCVPRGKKKPHTQIPSNGDLHEPTAPPALTVEEPMEVEAVRAPNLVSVKLENVDDPNSSKAETLSPSEDKKPVIRVECPVCSVGIPSNFINKHLDTCLTRGLKKESLRSSGGSRMRPMGKLVYHLLSLQELKRKLRDCHLSVHGSREQLVRKHQEFVHIYNAQCDSLSPRSAEDIAKEVEANEKTRSQLQQKAKPVMVFSKNQSEEEIDTMHSNYRKKHNTEFSRLIYQVQKHTASNRQARIKQEEHEEGEEVKEAQSAVQAAELKDCGNLQERLFMTSDETGEDSSSSISSSMSDIFGPEPAPNIENMTLNKTRKRAACSREEDAAPPLIPGKRKCKTLREDR